MRWPPYPYLIAFDIFILVLSFPSVHVKRISRGQEHRRQKYRAEEKWKGRTAIV
jgi:hypothetical protein